MALTEEQREYAREYQRRRRQDPAARAKDREYGRTHRSRNRERLNEQSRLYYHENKEAILAKRPPRYAVLKKYGMTLEQYDELLAQQGGACAISQTTEDPRAASMPVDHDHTTGRVRGILCSDCNLLLGYAKDSLERLDQAAEYLKGVVGE